MPPWLPRIRFTRRLARWVLSIVVVVLVICGIAAWQVPKLVRDGLTVDAARMIGREIAVGDITFNPFTLTLKLHELSVAQPDGPPLLTVVELDASASYASLALFAPVVDSLVVREPRVMLSRKDATTFNFSDIPPRIAQLSAGKPPSPPSDELPRFSLNNLVLEGGSIVLDDRLTGRRQVVDEIGIGVPFLSTLDYAADIDVEPRFHARINGSPLDLTGTARPFDETRSSTLNVDFHGLALQKWADAWPLGLPVKLERALLDADLQLVFEQPRGQAPKVRVAGDLGLRNLDLREASGMPLLAWDALDLRRVDLEPLAQRLAIGEIALTGPRAQVRRTAGGALNWLTVVDRLQRLGGATTPAASAAPAGGAPSAEARPAAGAADAADEKPAAGTRGAAPASAGGHAGAPDQAAEAATAVRSATSAETVAIGKADEPGKVDESAKAGESGKPAASARHDESAKKDAGPAKAAPGDAAGSGDAEAAEPARPTAWEVAIDAINVSGGEAAIHDAGSGLDYTVSGLGATVENLAIPQPADRPVAIWLNADNADGGRLQVRADTRLQPFSADASIDLAAWKLAPFSAPLQKMASLTLHEGTAELRAKVHAAQSASGVDVQARDVALGLHGLAMRDDRIQPGADLSLESLALTADRFEWKPGSTTRFKLDLAGFQGDGKLALDGTFSPMPMAVKTSVALDDFDLKAFAPYAAPYLNATVRGVAVGAHGDAEFAAASGSAPMRASWRGGLDVIDLELDDRVNKADFLKWGRLGFRNMAVDVAGDRYQAQLGDIVLQDFYGRVILNAQGRLNVMDLVAEPGQAGGSITEDTQTRSAGRASSRKSGPMPDISLNSVTLTRGRVNFTDRFVRPNYTADLTRIEGSVSAVSSTRPKPAKVAVKGRVYDNAPFTVGGTVQPFGEFLSLDIKASAKGVDLPKFTTYSAKYVGYPIKRGKLSLDVAYRIKDRELQASNRVVLNQLTFGDKNDSPDATKLPVMLAVALLKDRAGNIDINLPISGSLDDPQFSVGGIILRVFVNLIVKAVTSPFSLLASAFGGDQELSYIEFDPGSARLSGDAQERIGTLATALNDRPSLKLDVSGRADPAVDEDGLRQAWVEARIRAAKARDKSTRSHKVDPRTVVVEPGEREEYLEDAYDDADIENKPRNFIGMAKSLPPAEMEALLRAAAPVDQDALRRLADARAQAVLDQLQEKVSADRVFLVASQLDAAGIDDGGKTSRVDFSLQ